MKQTDQHASGVIGILTRARTYDPEIGSYMEHFLNDSFAFTIRLSNGRIEIPTEMAHDQETMPSSISENRIQNIAARFQNKNPKPIIASKPQVLPQTLKTISFWQRLLKWIGLK